MKKKTTRSPRKASQANRDAILKAALDVFSTHGFDGATTRQIATVAGIEQGHLVYYFPSKEELWREVLITFNAECVAALERALADESTASPIRRARTVLPALLRTFAMNPKLTRLMMQELSISSARHDWVVESFAAPIWKRLRPLFKALERAGELNADAAVSYFTLVGGAIAVFGSSAEIRQIAGLNVQSERVIDQHIALLVNAVLAPD